MELHKPLKNGHIDWDNDTLASSSHPVLLQHHLAHIPINTPSHQVSVDLKQSALLEPFNVDPDLIEILKINQQLIDQIEPILQLYPISHSGNTSPRHTNITYSSSLIHIIATTSLFNLGRFSQSEKLYNQDYRQIVKAKYGSTIIYLKQRLGFSSNRLLLDKTGKQIHYFTADQSLMKDGLDYKVVKNEWPYGIPKNYQHLTIWSRLPLLNPKLSSSNNDWKLAHEKGLSGFVNLSNQLIHKLEEFKLDHSHNLKQLQSSAKENLTESRKGLGDEIVKFIENRWKVQEGFEDLLWFLNPVYLQSCPELPHFHLLVKTSN
ncbi:hypothetical protein O181_057356 [Austropuccinia psidii MF-1]|uniref:Uncharacterized protein n=1 Tax=Austropuccinia psidii MF-1 TaxID=1389203 RepID=A0A9Q3EF17_9BASI|nr:hypothetical protein [Austropuccinia psidii MF-1]